MSEGMTSPAPAAPAAESAPAPSGEGISASADAAPVVESTETIETSGIEPEAPEVQTEQQIQPFSGFDAESWDGNLESLPDSLRGPVGHLHRHLESGYTKKFQDLADQRKQFEANQGEWEKQSEEWKVDRDDIVRERDILRTIMDGGEDPRVAELSGKNQELLGKYEELAKQHEEYEKLVDADLRTQADAYAQQFRSHHQEIFDSSEKRAELSSRLSEGWAPEEGVRLIGQHEDVVTLANELREQGTPQEVAVEHALLKAGVKKRAPRPAARLTSGAESRNNPASTPQSVNNAGSSNEARMFAAREAMNWSRTSKVK